MKNNKIIEEWHNGGDFAIVCGTTKDLEKELLTKGLQGTYEDMLYRKMEGVKLVRNFIYNTIMTKIMKDIDRAEESFNKEVDEYIANNEIIQTKTLRKSLDEQLQIMKNLPKSRETSLSITKLQESIMWLGMNLKRINEGPSPYPDSYNPSNTKIAPTADGIRL